MPATRPGFDVLTQSPAVCDELRQVIALGLAKAEHVSGPLEAGLQQVTLRTNAHYSREETLAALAWASLTRKPSAFVAGVVWSEAVQTDAFFVTLRKSEADYSPTTMYADYAISPRAVPLGVPERDGRELPDGPAIPQPPGRGQSCAHPDAGDAGQ